MRAPRICCIFAVAVAATTLAAGPALAWQADHLADRALEAREALVPVPLNPVDREFVGFALDRSRLKGQAMDIAVERSRSPELRVLASSMREEHRALTDSLLELAGRDSPAAVTDATEHGELATLREVDDAGFDERFIAVLRRLHGEAQARYRRLADDPAASPRVREHARDALPVIELHRRLVEDAEQLLASGELAPLPGEDGAESR
jgi:predicted outer membrane protein